MASFLKELSLAIGLLGSDPSASGPSLGLEGYVWRTAALQTCKARPDCVLIDSHWDWKRPQFYRVRIEARDRNKGRLGFRVELDNRDPADDDTVCFFAVVSDAAGKPLSAHFEPVFSRHRARTALRFSLPASARAVRLQIGSKQCDETKDADIRAGKRVEALIAKAKP